jgi:hypothetical protein
MPKVLRLQASITTKLQVIFMFSVGFLYVLHLLYCVLSDGSRLTCAESPE